MLPTVGGFRISANQVQGQYPSDDCSLLVYVIKSLLIRPSGVIEADDRSALLPKQWEGRSAILISLAWPPPVQYYTSFHLI